MSSCPSLSGVEWSDALLRVRGVLAAAQLEADWGGRRPRPWRFPSPAHAPDPVTCVDTGSDSSETAGDTVRRILQEMEGDIPARASADPCHLLEPSPAGQGREDSSAWPLFSSPPPSPSHTPPLSPSHTLDELVVAQHASLSRSVERVPVSPAEALLGEWQEQEVEKVSVGGRACCQAWRFDRPETFPLTGYQARLMESQLHEGLGPCSCGCRVSPAAAEWMRNWIEVSQDCSEGRAEFTGPAGNSPGRADHGHHRAGRGGAGGGAARQGGQRPGDGGGARCGSGH